MISLTHNIKSDHNIENREGPHLIHKGYHLAQLW
jgi:hypothetical protein